MKIGIFGRHPVPQPGFMGVMSLFEAIHLSRQGHAVELILPFADAAALYRFLHANDLQDLDALERFHGAFTIIPLIAGDPLPTRYDAIIWQSYEPSDHQTYFAAARAATRIMTKNFPKFVPGTRNAFHERVVSNLKTFDLVTCALQDDLVELRMNAAFWAQYGHRIAYVPRGADPAMLHPARKLAGPPTIGLEIPFTVEGHAAIEFYIEPIRRLQAAVPGLRVLTLGPRPHPEIRSEHIPYGRFDHLYERFFNEIWMYLIMDYALSPTHVAAPVQQIHPADWSGRAIYEVQNIEAQMAGAIIIGHPRNTIAELLDPGRSAFYVNDYADAERITALMHGVIANFPMLSQGARGWARAGFDWAHCMSLWADALETAISRLP